jgi:hypothetical protein
LIAALNKKGIHVTPEEYWEKWDVKQTQAAVQIAGFEKNIEEWIWQRDRAAFEVF